MDSPEFKPKTKDELTHLLSLLNQAQSFESASRILPSSIVNYIKGEMSDKKIRYEEVVKDIKTYLRSLKDIKLYLPFDPSSIFLQKIYEFFGMNFPDRYLDIYIDTSLIAGVKVVIDGTLYDECLATKIEKHF